MTLTTQQLQLVHETHALIHGLLSRGTGPSKTDGAAVPLTFGDCELFASERRLRRRGAVVHLTLQEFQLLHCLASHPGQALSRADLCELAWGREWRGDRSLDTFVSVIRRKLELHPTQPRMITLVHGFGYRFDPPPAPRARSAPPSHHPRRSPAKSPIQPFSPSPLD